MKAHTIIMEQGISQSKMFGIVEQSEQDLDSLLKRGVLYIREHLLLGEHSYLATASKEWVLRLLQEANGIKPFIDRTQELFAEFDKRVSMLSKDGQYECVYFHITNSLYGLKVEVNYLQMQPEYSREIITIENLQLQHQELAQLLKHKEVSITVKGQGGNYTLKTSHHCYILEKWLDTLALSEVFKVIDQFDNGYDIGLVFLPNIDKERGVYVNIPLLDIEKVEILME